MTYTLLFVLIYKFVLVTALAILSRYFSKKTKLRIAKIAILVSWVIGVVINVVLMMLLTYSSQSWELLVAFLILYLGQIIYIFKSIPAIFSTELSS